MGAWSWGAGVAGGDQVFGNHLGESDLQPVFDAAMERGLNLWDTATVYGMGASEDILGRFIRQGNKKMRSSSPPSSRRRSQACTRTPWQRWQRQAVSAWALM